MNEYFQASDIGVDLVCDDPLETNVPSWKLSIPVINLSMTSLKKDTTPESAYRQRFFEQSVITSILKKSLLMALLKVKKQLQQQFLTEISITPSNFVFQTEVQFTLLN